MSRRRRTLIWLLPALGVGIALGLTGLNAWYVRTQARQLLAAWSTGLPGGWELALVRLDGSMTSTALELRLSRPGAGRDMAVRGQLQHRLLASRFQADLRGPGAEPMGTLTGTFQPSFLTGAMRWELRLATGAMQGQDASLAWTLGPGSVQASGMDEQLELDLRMPRAEVTGGDIGRISVLGATLQLDHDDRDLDAPLRGSLQIERLVLRTNRLLAEAAQVQAEGRVRALAPPWPSELQLTAAEFTHQGLPFLRLTDVSYRGDGVMTAGQPAGAAALPPLGLHQTLVFQASSAQGPLALAGELALTPTAPRKRPALTGQLEGRVPEGLWQLLEQFNHPGARAQRLGGGPPADGQVRVRLSLPLAAPMAGTP